MSNAIATQSTGPRTEAGKARSRFNARKHNLTGQTLVTTDEDMAAYTASSKRLKDDLRPDGELEVRLVQSLADAYWQLDRARAIETNMFFELGSLHLPEHESTPGDGLAWAQAQAKAFLENGKQFDLIGRYANRFHRQVMQLTATLHKTQSDRRKQNFERNQNRLRRNAESLAGHQRNALSHTNRKRNETDDFVSQEFIDAYLRAPVSKEEFQSMLPKSVKKQAA